MATAAGNGTVWSLCLQSRQGRKIIKISSSSSTQALYNDASKELGSTVASLKFGFPPKTLVHDESTLISSVLQNQERLQVELATAAAATASGGGSRKQSAAAAKKKAASNTDSSSTTTTTSSSRTKSKRAAAKAATKAMPAIIKAQDELMKQQSTTSKKRARPVTVVNNNARTTSSSSSSSNKKPTTTPKNFSAGPGRRLADGAAVASPNKRRNASRGSKLLSPNKSSNSDMSEALMGALNDRGKMGQVLRKGMKNAVQASYETTRAFSRLAAIQSQSYTMTTQDNNNTLNIEFQGSVDKTKIVEQVECIPRDVLQAVLNGIYSSNPEALRPENIALLSPRVLWSLVHQFPNTAQIEDMYKKLFANDPDENAKDWSFLRRRAQQLSEKALENLRQQEEQNDDKDDGQKALEAVAAVEDAMEHLHDYERTERQARQAQAALARMQPTSEESSEWTLTTPSEPDRDELGTCIQEALPPGSGQRATGKWITRLMKECHIHNWRELANVTDTASLATKLGMSNDSVVSKWVDKAQEESVAEIVVEICDNNVEAVELLTEKARTGTPKDLAAWRRIPEMLQEQVSSDTLSVQQIAAWCDRAHRLLEEHEWLNWYATPVE